MNQSRLYKNGRFIRLGDKIERIIKKIPGVKKLPCHDQQTGQLKPESGCAKRKKKLNELGSKLNRVLGKNEMHGEAARVADGDAGASELKRNLAPGSQK